MSDISRHEVLERWFAFSGWDKDTLITAIERIGSGRPIAGLDPELAAQSIEGITNPAWKIAVLRAIQHMAIVRPWTRDQAKDSPKQQELFA